MSGAIAPSAQRRIMHFIESAGIYGAESVILNLSREMRADGRFVPVVGCIVQRSDEKVDLVDVAATHGIEAHRVRISNRLVPVDLLLAAKRLRALRIDAIHCHGYKPGVFAYVIGRLTGIEVLATCHLWFMESYAPWKMRLMIAIEKRLYSRYKAVIAVSDQIQRILLKNGVRPERTRVIKNGIVLADYKSEPHGKATGHPTRVLNVARLSEQKGQADLIAAAQLLAAQRVGVEVLIVGEGELRSALEHQIAEQGLDGAVRLLGFRDDVRELLSSSDIFVLPSLDEGMPISLLEAVASQVPVIVTAVGDIPKLISDGISGLVVKPKDPAMLAAAIERLVREPGLRRTFAENAWERLRQTFSSKQMFDAYVEVYSSLLGERR